MVPLIYTVLPKHTLCKILYFKELYFIYTSFQSNTLKILYYRIKLSKMNKNISFILYSLKYMIHVSSLSTNEHIQKKFARAFSACINNTYIFQGTSF